MKWCLAQITNVDQWPPASVNARYSVCSSEEDMHMYTAPLRYRQDVRAGLAQEIIELPAQRVVADLQFLGGLALVIHVVGRIGEDHVGQAAGQHLLDITHLRRVAAQEPMLAQNPHVAGHRDGALRFLRERRHRR